MGGFVYSYFKMKIHEINAKADFLLYLFLFLKKSMTPNDNGFILLGIGKNVGVEMQN